MRNPGSFAFSWLLLAVAAGCTVTASTGSSSGTCSPDSTVTGCGSALGYSCSGSDTPDEATPALTCGMGVQGNAGSTLYCCTTGSGDDVTGDDGGFDDGSGDDGAGDDGSNGPAPDSGVDSGTDSAPDAPYEDAACGIASNTGNVGCDQCLETQCCPTLSVCGNVTDGGGDDAGSFCVQLASCLHACLEGNADAGLDAGTLTSCSDLCGPSFSATDLANAQPFVTCEVTACAAQCQ